MVVHKNGDNVKYKNLIKRFSLALFVSTFFACGQQAGPSVNLLPINAPAINLSQDPSFGGSSPSVYILNIATHSIDSRTGSEIIYNPSAGSRSVLLSYADLETNVLGQTLCDIGDNWCTIKISKTLNPENYVNDPGDAPYYQVMLQEVLTHEIGHTFGFGHWSNPNYIMYAYENNANVSDSALDTFVSDLTNFREHGTATGYPTLGSTSTSDTSDQDFMIINYNPSKNFLITDDSSRLKS
jgi:hypothetical protein